MHVGVDPGIPRCRHSGDNSCGVSNDKARVCGLWDARSIVMVAQRPVDWRPASCAAQYGVCVCWHAGPSPHSLLQNLQLCILPAVSLPASLLLLLQIRQFIKELHSSKRAFSQYYNNFKYRKAVNHAFIVYTIQYISGLILDHSSHCSL